jgi:uncharacterized protein (TIGR02145 family)
MNKSFTLVELLIVIGILAVLSAAIVVVLNPAELLKQARDSKRLQDLASIEGSINISQAIYPGIDLGTASTVYISISDTTSTCANLGLPDLPSGWTYNCVTSANLINTDGTGWVPVNFQDTNLVGVIQLVALPIDPTNTTSTGLYYTYTKGSYELTTLLESSKYQIQVAAKDGGLLNTVLEKRSSGLSYSLTPAIMLTRPFPCGSTFTDSRDSKEYATVLIGVQCWMAEHLNYGTMTAGVNNQGSDCPSVAATEKYCYDDTESICTSDGALYQWDQIMCGAASCNGTGSGQPACTSPVQGICPSGWHIPSHYEYVVLERGVCDSGSCTTDFPYNESTTGWLGTDEGTQLKVGGSSGWEGILTGYRFSDGSFISSGSFALFQSSLESGSNAWKRNLGVSRTTVFRNEYDKLSGLSVRCIKD